MTWETLAIATCKNSQTLGIGSWDCRHTHNPDIIGRILLANREWLMRNPLCAEG
ncbi:hypothetical protein [Okeania sp. SIO2G5]|uniref:hypothetical protein n=1 Tax=Okeania sp. SIO2G5 TaxID=2607796 RepID=UPI0013C149DB|nr:hypothetical protein [Okeania sp. SIO2G5]NEP76699.1 hypothetical protein [Okeania sp. SIO2G5]